MPRSMPPMPPTLCIEKTLRALHALSLEQAETNTAIHQGLALPLMTFRTQPRSIHLAGIIRSFEILHTSPSNSQHVYILPIKLDGLLPPSFFCAATIANIHTRHIWVLPIQFPPREPAISMW